MTFRALLSAALCALALPVAAGEPTPAEILGRARAAQGGDAWDSIQSLALEGKIASGGLEGAVRSAVDASGRYRDEWQLGPLKGVNGWDGQRAWSQDPSGMPRVEDAEAARQGVVSEAYRRAQGWWSPARAPAEIRSLGERREGDDAYEVLSITPKGGRPFELWVKPDGLFARFVEVVDGFPMTTFLSDWREVGGVKLPFALKTTRGDGQPEHDLVVAWSEVVPNAPVSDATFAVPAPPPPDYGFGGGRRETTVPFQIVNGHIYLDVRLNGRGPFRLVVDSGGSNIVTPAVAEALGLVSEGRLPVGGAGEKLEDLGVVEVKRVQIGGAFVLDQTFLVYPLDRLAPVEGIAEQGMVGYEVFRRFATRIDYARSRLTLFAPDTFRYEGPGAVVPFVFNQHIPQVDGEIDGLPGKFDLDTGSRSSLDLLAPFVEAHGLIAKYGATNERIDGFGVGGPVRGYVVRAGVLKLGPVEIPAPVTGLSASRKGAFAATEVAGNVGYGVLSRFTVYLDYAHQKVVLEKNARFARRDRYDQAGLWVHLVEGTFEVIEVVPGAPAAEAGLLVGDRIVSVDGGSPGRLTLHGFRRLLRERPAGTRVELRVRRADGEHRLRIVLRELV
ncbi:MAG TPA: aspartyl protease family protein [Anaeromyxobacter sp.]|nr:aspartyl protease family protein [Anaeromyxobacter sp.]